MQSPLHAVRQLATSHHPRAVGLSMGRPLQIVFRLAQFVVRLVQCGAGLVGGCAELLHRALPRGLGMLGFLLLLVAFPSQVFAQEEEVLPVGTRSPMCGESAESIAAPPPLVAASESEARHCRDSTVRLNGAAPLNDNHTRLASSSVPAQQFGLVVELLSLKSFPFDQSWPLSESESPSLSEHRWTPGRPPSR